MKINYDAKISDTEKKYITTSGYNKFTNDILGTKIKHEEIANKFDNSGFINKTTLKFKLATLATKEELKTEQHKTKNLQTYGLSFYWSKFLLPWWNAKFFTFFISKFLLG